MPCVHEGIHPVAQLASNAPKIFSKLGDEGSSTKALHLEPPPNPEVPFQISATQRDV